MGARRGDRLRVGVEAGDRETEPGHRLGNEAAATADIGEPQAGERRKGSRVAVKMREQMTADEIDAHGVYVMERPKAARWVPPARTLRGEPIDVLRVYRVTEFTHAPGSVR